MQPAVILSSCISFPDMSFSLALHISCSSQNSAWSNSCDVCLHACVHALSNINMCVHMCTHMCVLDHILHYVYKENFTRSSVVISVY